MSVRRSHSIGVDLMSIGHFPSTLRGPSLYSTCDAKRCSTGHVVIKTRDEQIRTVRSHERNKAP